MSFADGFALCSGALAKGPHASASVLAEIANMVEPADLAEISKSVDFTGALRGNEWCCQTGLNCRPLHYQWSALPLSYGSMAPDTRIGPKGPPRSGPILATSLPPAQARERPVSPSKTVEISAGRRSQRPDPADQAPNRIISSETSVLARSMLSGANRSMLRTAARPAGHSCRSRPGTPIAAGP
jgi:hypothetical protein